MTSQHAIRLRAWVIHLTVASLLLAQSLGFLHRTVHAQAVSGAAAATVSQAASLGVASLFAAHALDTDCRLYDQLAHADLAALPTHALPCDFSSAPQQAELPCGRLPATARSYCARGPPALA
jgi:hypothetical protein